jgi:L-ascorbate metabolism protein UlaG (beta-lactamase superfamily)
MSSIQFGGKLTEPWLATYGQSPNWKNGAFQNLVTTQTALNWRQFPGILYKQFKGHTNGYPRTALPILPFSAADFVKPSPVAKLVWYGHSAVAMRIRDQTILIDPMFGEDASPVGPVRTRRFSKHTMNLISDLPDVDLVLITHDHYDHLDYRSIDRLKGKVKHWYVALGVKRHLVRWGIDPSFIDEFDWWDTGTHGGIDITFTPTRHFSGRGLTSIGKCLWGGWAIKTTAENIWFSGDGGYADHFKDIGSRLGPFDFGMMECGQYNTDWAQIHLFPDEAVKAAIDAGVRVAMPVHWAGFNLSYYHAWYEPAEVFVKQAMEQDLKFLTPGLGQVFGIQDTSSKWWEEK